MEPIRLVNVYSLPISARAPDVSVSSSVGVIPYDPRVAALRHSTRCRERSRCHTSGMTKTQCRELKTVLVMIASRLSSEVLDDDMQILLYRAQTLAEASLTNRSNVREALSRAG